MIPNPVLNHGGAGVRLKRVGLSRRQRDFWQSWLSERSSQFGMFLRFIISEALLETFPKYKLTTGGRRPCKEETLSRNQQRS